MAEISHRAGAASVFIAQLTYKEGKVVSHGTCSFLHRRTATGASRAAPSTRTRPGLANQQHCRRCPTHPLLRAFFPCRHISRVPVPAFLHLRHFLDNLRVSRRRAKVKSTGSIEYNIYEQGAAKISNEGSFPSPVFLPNFALHPSLLVGLGKSRIECLTGLDPDPGRSVCKRHSRLAEAIMGAVCLRTMWPVMFFVSQYWLYSVQLPPFPSSRPLELPQMADSHTTLTSALLLGWGFNG